MINVLSSEVVRDLVWPTASRSTIAHNYNFIVNEMLIEAET